MLKLCLYFLLLQASTGIQCSRSRHPGWTLVAPSRVGAVEGSCVVIPCSYSFPRPRSPRIRTVFGLWKKAGGGANVAATRHSYYIHPSYRDRTDFLGPIWRNNCTWVLERVTPADAGEYFFRVELPEYKSFSWDYQPTQVEVLGVQPPRLQLISDGAGAGSGGQGGGREVTALCSVVHSCPLHQPTFSWSHGGRELTVAQPALSTWKWLSFSVLTLSPGEEDPQGPLRCTVHYRGGSEALSALVLSRPQQ